ncbi:hypothetical protein HWN40_06205 [Methanolobus zinderi]|uniref:DUF4013 domain-containing protein n=1 Tax=Methanolobus zinderi TaxID=536044 RepID=A0A7D5I434_9EURY|nr:hypothetical protein [Methanolobus zinderi]QLC49868.1 hypothetical protein HWN40_06205 [Methanolobus zinderi]
MSWYVVDAVDRAFERTKKCLIEPFDFWKWMKLTIIVLLVGGGMNFNTGGGNYSFDETDMPVSQDFPTGAENVFENIYDTVSMNALAYMVGAILLIILLALIFAYISSVMEFVLVESLVSNDVRFWEYSRSFLGKGFGLFLFRLLLGILYLLIIAIVALPFIYYLTGQTDASLESSMLANIVYLIFLLIFIFFVLGVIGGIIGSFVNLAIPVSLYAGSGIFGAFSMVVKKFRQDWKQIIIYWIGRIVLNIAVAIVVGIAVLIMSAIALLLFLVFDGAVYFVLSALTASDTLVWIILAPVVFIQLIIFVLAIAFVSMPARVFVKYHMLTFLQMWYPEIEVPIFDRYKGSPMEDTATSL